MAAALVGIPLTLAAGPRLLKNLRDETIVKDAEGRLPQVPWKPMALLCVVMTLAYIGESSVSNAGSVYLTKGLKSSDTLGGLVSAPTPWARSSAGSAATCWCSASAG